MILYAGGPTNQNKCCVKSGGGDQYIGGPLDFKEGDIPPPPVAAPLATTHRTTLCYH